MAASTGAALRTALASAAMSGLGRRSLLKGAGAIVATRALAPRPAASVSAATSPFQWGVASFDPTTESVLLWTRVDPALGADVEVGWTVATDPDLAEVVTTGSSTTGPGRDHCVAVEVDGLTAGGVWWYRFTAPDGSTSPVGRTRTIAEDPARLRLATVSCSRYATDAFGVYQALSQREVDLVLHLGDYIYEDGSAGARPHEPAHRLTTLDDYRARYAQHRSDPALQALHARHPMLAVWDDHEVAQNAWRDGASGHDEGRDGPWSDRLVAAGRAHDEWLPGRTETADDGRLRAWRALPLGELARLVVLDTRNWARDRQPSDAGELVSGWTAGQKRSMLGEDQRQHVLQELTADDRAPWLLLANQVMYHPLAVPVPTEAVVQAALAAGLVVIDGAAYNPDQWDGYAAERAELAEAMGSQGGVVVLSGDVHSSWGWEGPAQADGEPVMVEVVAPSVTSTSVAERLGLPAGTAAAGFRLTNPDLSYVDLTAHGYVILDLTADEMQAEWWHVDPADPASEQLGGARRAPRQPPMRFTPVNEPTADPEPTTAQPDPTSTTATSGVIDPTEAGSGDDSSDLPLAVGAGAAVLAAAAAVVGVRRRRS